MKGKKGKDTVTMDTKPIQGWKTTLSGDRVVSVQLLKCGDYSVWFENPQNKTGVRITGEAALALYSILDRLLLENADPMSFVDGIKASGDRPREIGAGAGRRRRKHEH